MPKYICTECGHVFTAKRLSECPWCHRKSFVDTYARHQAYLKKAKWLYHSHTENPKKNKYIAPKKESGIGKRKLYEVRDVVTISSEEPIYDEYGKNIAGKKGKIVGKTADGKYIIELENKQRVFLGRGLLAAPEWFYKLSSEEMERYLKSDNRIDHLSSSTQRRTRGAVRVRSHTRKQPKRRRR